MGEKREDLRYFGIPDYILDGIHPEQDTAVKEDRAIIAIIDNEVITIEDAKESEVNLYEGTTYHNQKT